ncbi:patellin-6-like [Cannabis sativa]|uniref:patellin-6-like n=1 Tax=Cannabis sativa TaxID=3483 RepID=UPI0029C9F1A6|nr:patellin-6-like [Cannabis sativa]
MAAEAPPGVERQRVSVVEDDSSVENSSVESEEEEDDDFEFINQGDDEELNTNHCIDQMSRKKKKALLEFRCRVEDSILGNYLIEKPPKSLSQEESIKQRAILKETTLWGIPLLPSKSHEGTDFVLLKFLKAKDFKVNEAFNMLRRTLKWRIEYKTNQIIDEKLCPFVDIENGNNKVFYYNSVDKQGRPLCYHSYEAFKDEKFCRDVFGSQEKFNDLLRWRIQVLEKGIEKLSFKNGGVSSILQIIDLKNSPGPAMKELGMFTKKALLLLQDNYPELIHKNIIINVPFWYYVVHILRSRFLTLKTKQKFVFARSSEVTKTLLKFIAAENIPVEYGGLKRENDKDFSPLDEAAVLKIKGNTTVYVKFPVSEVGLTMVWDFTVVGWDVSYKEEFIPDDEGSYKILLQNQNHHKKRFEDHHIHNYSVRNSFYINEPGKICITIHNPHYKKKTLLYRSKANPTIPMYILFKK